MGILHEIIEHQGKQVALLTEADRRAVEAAAAYMADEDNGIGFLVLGPVPSRLASSPPAR